MTQASSRYRTALIVFESMFGNTAHLARAVGHGLRAAGVETVLVDAATTTAPERVAADLLVLAAPTHAMSLSDATTRADAVRQGARPDNCCTGLREWLVHAHPDPRADVRVAAFDTRAHRHDPEPDGAAASALAMARLQGFWPCAPPQVFHVTDVGGPLAPGEMERATAWGRGLAEVHAGVR